MPGFGYRNARELTRAIVPPDDESPSDAESLQRFVAERDGSAFALLVRRHGPMVLGECQRITGNPHDADDAFQVAFLVLARRAASIDPPSMVASWLHGVAYRCALEVRSIAQRRRARERLVDSLPDVATHMEHPLEGDERRELIDGAVRRLPEKYRTAVVLCEMEGRSRSEAAATLGIPEGTLSSRLATARKLLARRLSGYRTSMGALATTATVRSELLASTIGLATGADVPPRFVEILKGATEMTFSKTTQSMLVGVVVLGLIGGGLALSSRAEPGAPAPLSPPEVGFVSTTTVNTIAEDDPLADYQPVIVKTVPISGAIDVDANLTELRATFSKDMIVENYSWVQVDADKFPETTGKPYFEDDQRTCVLPVKLQPGKTYVIWLNQGRFNSFMDTNTNRAVPYLLVFHTKEAD